MKNTLLIFVLIAVAVVLLAAPADGTWTLSGNTANAPHTLVLQTSGNSLAGTADGAAITTAGVKGSDLWFRVNGMGFKGTISGTQMTLHADKISQALVYNHQ